MSRHRRPQGFNRTDRIADQIQRELSRLLQFEVKDPRVNLATIQDVTVSRDLSYAEVYFTLLGKGEEEGVEAEAVLEKAAGFLRSSLAKNLNTRTTPKLRFHYDTTPEHAAEISRLIDDARAEDRELGLDSDDSEQN
ncbi:MAG: 30S ribosome-binding factor RbfA [Pseudomonadota bacterium]|jgi:ribosome-binding factor A|uniref:30S ribosome-binding factor RbfA n=1 Tax=Alcanivorax sp. TaxID=1872427 RepID=UPI0024382A95|nr:30S ribosome-binding factor RbfA [Alcanivorax sp.]MED5238541.1 30S ribosome-binding factor RbfA [Pseudomonadota bacterium]MEE3319217.1 30S ribosome-binding factor RbfA [Pseudomonadota bacterium]